MKKILLIIFIASFCNNILNAQNKITGKIIDKNTQKPIEFVNVFVLNSQNGTVSNNNGEYELSRLSKSNKLLKIQYSLLGYKTILKNVKLNGSTQNIDIELEPSVLKTDEVVISGGSYSTQHENAISIESISPDKLYSTSTASMIGTLTKRPGLDMIALSPGVAKPVIRGLSMTNILMLNNGVKLQNFQFSEDHPFIIDEYGIDKIEYIKGPASILYGSSAVGGVINFIKEKPATLNRINGDFHQQYNSNNQGIVSNVGIKGNSNNFIWGFRTGIKSNKDFTSGDNVTVTNSRFNEQSAKANLGIIRPFGSFKLYYDYNYDKLGMTVPPAIKLNLQNERKNNVWYQNLHNQVLSSRNVLFFGNQQVNINASYQNNHRQLITSSQMPADTMVDLDLQTISYEINTHLQKNDKTSLIIGVQGDLQNNKNGNAPSHIIPNAIRNDIGFVSLFQTKFLNKLNAQVGARYDIVNINIPNQSYSSVNSNDSSITFPMNLNYNNFSASGGLTYNITKLLLIRLNLASAFRSPNLAELTQNGLHDVRYEIGNPKMLPQRNYESDFAIHFHNNNLAISVSPFYNLINNYIYLSPTTDTTTDGYSIYRYSQNNAVIYGGEFSFDYANNKNYEINASYSYLLGKQNDGNYLPLIPQNKIRLNLKYNFGKVSFIDDLYGSAGTVYAQEQNNPSIFEEKSPSYYLVNLSIGGKIKIKKQNLDFSVNVNNLLNQKYYDHLSLLKEVGFYNIGRNISVNLNIPFSQVLFRKNNITPTNFF